MDEDQNVTDETLQELQTNIERKQYALEVLDSDHTNICLKIESDLNSVEELAKKICSLESVLRSSECRLEEYDKKENELEKEVNFLKNNVSALKQSFEEESQMSEENDTIFDETIIKMIQERRKDREIFDSNSGREHTEYLQELNSSLSQEIFDIKKALNEIKTAFPLVEKDDLQFILKNTDVQSHLDFELNKMKQTKSKHLEKLNSLKENMLILENEIKQLSKQL